MELCYLYSSEDESKLELSFKSVPLLRELKLVLNYANDQVTLVDLSDSLELLSLGIPQLDISPAQIQCLKNLGSLQFTNLTLKFELAECISPSLR